ncbi:MAG: DUF4197 domain-containing protein [Sediminibacterium sp.]|nr:DUF4197 domain-containing protein [Sediminibacterium sp.]
MKKIQILIGILLLISTVNAQDINSLLKKVGVKPQDSKSTSGNINIAEGLKEALIIGAEKGATLLSQPDAFLGNAARKILLPPEATKIENTLRQLGMGKQVDEAIVSMNRAAEDACKTAAPIFISAIKEMTLTDAVTILKGSDTAATSYLKEKTTAPLTTAFRPVIEGALEKTNATKHWNSLVTAYNRFSLKKINPDLAGYVTERTMQGVYQEIAAEEQNIRKNPAARTTALLKSVFNK